MEDIEQTYFPGMVALSEESYLAGKIKKETQILVILGNPPYSGHSSNVGEWISNEIKEYYKVDGKPLGERNPKWLQDDYVKFIRFAQWKIDQNGEGVLGFITNHSYIDNPTFRGMRQSLMKSFDEIFILDLHGNTLKKERCPDGSKDENVFDIRQGVAISLFIKKKEKKGECKIFHSDLWGLRDYKYEQLLKNDFKIIKWQEINPKSEFYLFIPRDEALEQAYLKYYKITDIFPVNGVGMTTARDNFVINRDKNVLLNRIRLFKNNSGSDDELHQIFQINKKKGWSIRKAWNMLQSITESEIEDLITPVLYRPFDIRWIFYHDSLVWRTVKRVMVHMSKENIGLIVPRLVIKKFQHTFCTNNITNFNALDIAGRFGSFILKKTKMTFSVILKITKQNNQI
jgi:predicted helicase